MAGFAGVPATDVATAGPSPDAALHETASAPPWTLYIARDAWTLRAPDGGTTPRRTGR